MAKSVLTALVERISNASVTLEVLEILQKHKQRFLELLKANSTDVNEGSEDHVNVETKTRLDERIEEIQRFQAVKKKVVSFINMCDLIAPGKG